MDKMHTKVGMDFGRIIRIENELATKLKAGMNSVAFAFEMATQNTDSLFM
jgi:hypothetical protein